MPQQDYYIRSYRLRRKCLGSARKAFDLTVLEIEKELE
jgi:hypothetical protein